MSSKRTSSSEYPRPSSTDVGPVIIDSGGKKSNRQNAKQVDLLQREADYKRLNEELEAKTTSLFEETESMLRQQEEYLAAATDLETAGPDYYVGPHLVDDAADGDGQTNSFDFSNKLGSLSLSDQETEEVFQQRSSGQVRPDSRPNGSNALSRPATSSGSFSSRGVISNQAPFQHRSITAPGKVRGKSRTTSRRSSTCVAEDVALVEDPSMMHDLNLVEAFERIGHDVDGDAADIDNDKDDDILPPPAQEMGHEAKVRFLKAKVRVLQEELDKISSEKSKLENDGEKQAAKMKTIEEDRNRLQKSASTQQSAVSKQKQIVDDLKAKLTAAETQASTLKRQNEQLQRDVKTQQNNVGATEVRLNRALEEIEKLKSEVMKFKTKSKESQEDDKKRMETLLAENRRLEKQKTDLIQGFRKQARLVDILKRQKMHLEAAKMLQFTEDEFVKALEWGSG